MSVPMKNKKLNQNSDKRASFRKLLISLPFVSSISILAYYFPRKKIKIGYDSQILIRNGKGCIYSLYGYFKTDRFRAIHLIFVNLMVRIHRGGRNLVNLLMDRCSKKGVCENLLPSNMNHLEFTHVEIEEIPNQLNSVSLICIDELGKALKMLPTSISCIEIELGFAGEFENGTDVIKRLERFPKLEILKYRPFSDLWDLFCFDASVEFSFANFSCFKSLKKLTILGEVVKQSNVLDSLPNSITTLEFSYLKCPLGWSHLPNLRRVSLGCIKNIDLTLAELPNSVKHLTLTECEDKINDGNLWCVRLPELESLYFENYMAEFVLNISNLPLNMKSLHVRGNSEFPIEITGNFSLPKNLSNLICVGVEFKRQWTVLPIRIRKLVFRDCCWRMMSENSIYFLNQNQFDFVMTELKDLEHLTIGNSLSLGFTINLITESHQYLKFDNFKKTNTRFVQLLGPGIVSEPSQFGFFPDSLKEVHLYEIDIDQNGISNLPTNIEKFRFIKCKNLCDKCCELLTERFESLEAITLSFKFTHHNMGHSQHNISFYGSDSLRRTCYRRGISLEETEFDYKNEMEEL